MIKKERFCECEESVVENHNRILSSISHDLKSPMVGILGFSQLALRELRAEKEPNPRLVDLIERIYKVGGDMHKLIQDILAMAKMEAGKEKVEPEWINEPEKELHEVIDTFEDEARAKGIQLSLNIASMLPEVRWDMTRLRFHVLNNLVSNALKFTPKGGSVSIHAESKNGCVMLKVKDTGPGIPEEEQERIFLRFEQLEMKTERVYKGVGLGLHNAHLFVKQHGGKLYLENSVKQGATFVMELPVDALVGKQTKTVAA